MDDYRFHQRFELVPQGLGEGQSSFNPRWKYWFDGQGLIRDGRLIYLFPSDPQPYAKSLTERDSGFRQHRYLSGEVDGNPFPDFELDPHTPMGMVMYRCTLGPGQSRQLVFKMPLAPVPELSTQSQLVQSVDFDRSFEQTVDLWNRLVVQRAPFSFPEKKVQEALVANTIFNLLAIDKVGEDYIPNVNKFQYHTFYPTDNSLTNVALDDMGLSAIAAKTLRPAMKNQAPDGALNIHGDLWETFGHVLWAWGRHYQLSGDRDLLQEVYPAVEKAMAWEIRITRADPLGLIPAATVNDDAQLAGCYQTGQDLWTLVGIRNAIRMAQAMGKADDAGRFEAEYKRFWAAFEKQLAVQTAKTGGAIPPALDRTVEGNAWDNLHTLYPEPLFDPFDPRVTATIQQTRATYQEGILPYVWPRAVGEEEGRITFNKAPGLMYWHTPDNSESQLVRDGPKDQELAVQDLYNLLLHTTSTHATQEFGTHPWSDRDLLDWNILPDGSNSATLIELMRNMLVREYQQDLYLFSALSPDWMQPGKSIEISSAPTVFGPVSAVLKADSTGWTVKFTPHFRQPPARLLIPVPWFYLLDRASADGQPLDVRNGFLQLSPGTSELRVTGRLKPQTPAVSFDETVAAYKREYRQRYEEFLRTGAVR